MVNGHRRVCNPRGEVYPLPHAEGRDRTPGRRHEGPHEEAPRRPVHAGLRRPRQGTTWRQDGRRRDRGAETREEVVPFTKRKREQLRSKGYSAKEIRELEADLDDDEEEEEEPSRRKRSSNGGGRQVFVLRGAGADPFMDRVCGGDDEAGDEGE